MINDIFNILSEYLYQSFWLAVLSSFFWGILSIILSPCHLSSIPLIIGFLSSQGEINLKKTFTLSLVFALGILITISLIGGISLSLGRIMGDIGAEGNYFVAAILFIVGLYLLEIIKIPWYGANMSGTRFKGYIAALILGLIFGIGLGPCTFAFMAPILAVVFQTAGTDLFLSISLLTAFAIGHIFVIVLAGTLTKKVQQYLNWTENSKAIKNVKKICGILVILSGIYFIYTAF